MKATIYWKTKDRDEISYIRDKFNFPSGTTINGETPVEISEEELALLRELESKGLIQIRYK